MNTENCSDRLDRIRLFFEGLCSWIPTFVGMTLESLENLPELIECGPWAGRVAAIPL
jgi:hypothetical protein